MEKQKRDKRGHKGDQGGRGYQSLIGQQGEKWKLSKVADKR